jgi:hypothetical protein
VFGFDDDTPDVFRQTLELLDRIGIDAIQAVFYTRCPARRFSHDGRPHFRPRLGNTMIIATPCSTRRA